MSRKSVLLGFVASLCAFPASAFNPDNFLAEYKAEGYDMTFKDQHENIFLLLLGLCICFLISRFVKDNAIRMAVRFSGIAIIVFSLINMALGITYTEYAWIALMVLVAASIILFLIRDNAYVFISYPIFIGALTCSFMIDLVDYEICNKSNQYPPEYGLQWRPFYQGFTDNAYFSNIEKNVISNDNSKILYNLLTEEVHSFNHPFNYLKERGWEIRQSGRCKVFINPDNTMGYVQLQEGGGLEPIHCFVGELSSFFPQSCIKDITSIDMLSDIDNIIVLTTVANDITRLYLRNFTHDWFNDFVNLKDSVLSLPDSVLTDIIPKDSPTFSLNKNYYEISKPLIFPTDTLEQIKYEGPVIRIRFKNPEVNDKVYTNNCMTFVEIDFIKDCIRLRRF